VVWSVFACLYDVPPSLTRMHPLIYRTHHPFFNGDKLATTLVFLVGLEWVGMPWDVFWVVLDLLMPAWDPLRRKGPRITIRVKSVAGFPVML